MIGEMAKVILGHPLHAILIAMVLRYVMRALRRSRSHSTTEEPSQLRAA